MQYSDASLVSVTPSERQFAWQQTEFYGFIHLTVNTFTGREWGDGTESPAIFNPDKLDARQWVDSVKSAGMKGLILTCKHHDGFCLWPSRYTAHTVAGSPYKNGEGNIVREVSDACHDGGIKFGIYLSPWDRNQPLYGTGTAYDDYFVNQLTELLTGYGPIFSVWFDGACGENAQGKKQVYDWDRYYAVIRELQPDACISVCGPDVRWCGNEAGHTRTSEWSVVPHRTMDTEKIAAESQKQDDSAFRERPISAMDEDLGSRQALKSETELIWYPAEVNTSIRPGWFYHVEEDDKVKSTDELFDIFCHAVGGNACFLLNIPPNREGLFHPADVACLSGLGEKIHSAFAVNLLEDAALAATSTEWCRDIQQVRDDTEDAYYMAPEGCSQVEIDINWSTFVTARYLVLKENIRLSQRIERFRIQDQDGTILAEGTTVGYKKIVPLPAVHTRGLKLIIEDARVCPTLLFVGVY